MARSGGPTVGIDIGSNMIKVAEVVAGRSGVTVRALGMAPTPPGSMENSVIVDPQLLGQAVKKLLREAGVGSKSSVSSVSGQSALVVRVIEVPRMSDSELAETMRWEVERQVPFAADEVIMDYQPINRPDAPPDDQNMEVLLAVAQQDMIDRHVTMLFAAGLQPGAIDVEPLAAARSLVELGPNPYGEKTVIILNVGASNTDLGIFRNGILSFPRTLPLAGDSLTRAIAAHMGTDEQKAEEMKINYGEVILDQMAQPQAAPADAGFLDFSVPGTPETADAGAPGAFDLGGDAQPQAAAPSFDVGEAAAPPAHEASGVPATVPQHDPTKLEIFTAMAPVLGELLTELRRSVEYYRGRTQDGRIDEIVLAGGTAKLKGLDRLLETDLGIPTRVANPLQFTPVATRNYSPEYLEDIAPFFAVAVGLAARDMVAVPVPAGAGGKRGKQ